MSKLVTVLMSVHNENRGYLQTSIQSICAQTYKNIEFVIVDDASEEKCHNSLMEIIGPYPFIKVLVNDTNMGITKSLHRGLAQASGEYIARMDADDFSDPTRLEKQVAFLEENRNIDILGGAVVSFGAKTIFMSPCNGMDDNEIKSELFFTSALCHPAVMIRHSFLKKYRLNYDCEVNKGQDYEFWERCSIYGRFAVLKDVILYYRIHDKQISAQNRSEQMKTADMVMKRRLARINLVPTEEEYNAHLALKGIINNCQLDHVEAWAIKLIRANKKCGFVDNRTFQMNIRKRLAVVRLKHKRVQCKDVAFLFQCGYARIVMQLKLMKEKHNSSEIE